MAQSWQDIAANKRAEVAKKLPSEWRLPASITGTIKEDATISVFSVPAECGLLTSKELDITGNHTAVDLIQKMASKEISALEVTTAFCKRAAIAHQVTNCLTEMFFDMALDRAKELDDYLAKEGIPMGPLHGMPISIKDHVNLKGTASCIGFVGFVKNGPVNFNSPIVDILLEAGAVLYCKTNIPQTMMTMDSHNNVFGRVLNPNKLCLGAGGSSGGEGALVAMRGSILGIGSDIGGSIRGPALINGTYGFKPSVHRIPFAGQTLPSREGMFGIDPVLGPLAQSPHDMRLLLETVIKAEPWNLDCSAFNMPWRSTKKKNQLVIGVIPECPTSPVTPPISRAIKAAATKLEAAGHTIIHLTQFPSFKEANTLSINLFSIDNNATGFKFATDSGEPLVPSVINTWDPYGAHHKPKTLDDVFDYTAQRWAYRAAWHKIFVENKLDVLITPGALHTAVEHDQFIDETGVPYTVIWNLVPFPAAIVPYLKADKTIDKPDPRTPKYDPEMVHGMPCHLQIAARNEQDEELMDAVEIIAEVLKDGRP